MTIKGKNLFACVIIDHSVDVNDKENKGLKKLKNELQDLYKKNAQYSTDILDLTKRNTQLEGQIYKLSEELAQ